MAQRGGTTPSYTSPGGGSAPVAYTTWQGTTVQRRPFVGRRMALLIAPERTVQREVIERVLGAVDRAWEWYGDYFDRQPTLHKAHAGKATIAEVTGGRAAANFTGIELEPDTMSRLLTEAARDRYNQATFFVMGRIFWYAGAALGKIPAMELGFAYVHRFHAMEAAGLTGAPWDDNLDFDNYKRSVVVGMLDRYLADPSLNWQNTLAADKAPSNPQGWGAGELAAAFFHRIRRDHGNESYRRFWRVMMDAPKAETPRDCAARFVQVARATTGTDYRPLLRDMSLPTVF
jgi:hypothetical protein